MFNIVKTGIIAMLMCLVFTPIIRKIALKFGICDIPKDDRRVHKKPIALLGGVAIYLAVIIAMLIFCKLDKCTIGIMIAGTIVFVMGVLDDITDLSPKVKFFWQIVAAVIVVYYGVKIDFIKDPFSSKLIMLGWFSIPVSIFWIVGITNTINIIDGLDGLAAGVSMISSLTLLIIASKLGHINAAIGYAIIAGACIGFLPYNFNPAKIFMGDAGALFLGFMLAVLSIEGVMKSAATVALLMPILGLSIPIFDTTFAILRRKMNGQKVSSADRGHLHHRLLDKMKSQKKAVLILYGISALYGILAIVISSLKPGLGSVISVLVLLLTLLMAIKFGVLKKR